MLIRFVDKNKFGGYTWKFSFDNIYPITIQETNDGSYLVEFKEFKWLYMKTHFSFISRSSMEETIVEALDRVFNYFITRKDYNWTKGEKELYQKRLLEEMRNSLANEKHWRK